MAQGSWKSLGGASRTAQPSAPLLFRPKAGRPPRLCPTTLPRNAPRLTVIDGGLAGVRSMFATGRASAGPRGRRVLHIVVTVASMTGCDVPTGLPRFASTWRFPTADVVVPVAGVQGSTTVTEDLTDVDISDRVRSAVIRIRPENAAGATGTITFSIQGGGVTVRGTVNVVNPAVQTIPISEAEVRALLGSSAAFTASGTVCRAGGCGPVPPPHASVTLKTELELVLEVGGDT